MLSRSSEQPIDFDIDVAKKQDSSNPVYYDQYAHARICKLLRDASGPRAKRTWIWTPWLPSAFLPMSI